MISSSRPHNLNLIKTCTNWFRRKFLCKIPMLISTLGYNIFTVYDRLHTMHKSELIVTINCRLTLVKMRILKLFGVSSDQLNKLQILWLRDFCTTQVLCRSCQNKDCTLSNGIHILSRIYLVTNTNPIYNVDGKVFPFY